MSCTSIFPIFGEGKDTTLEEVYNVDEQVEVQNLNSKERAIIGNLNLGSTVYGEIKRPTTEDSYNINLDKAGTLKLICKSYISWSVVRIYEKNSYNNLKQYYVSGGDEYSPIEGHIEIDLEAGQYTVKIDTSSIGWSSYEGKYELTAIHTPANTNDIEPNNGTEIAQPLQLSKTIVGFLSENDKSDYYKIVKVKPGKLNFKYKAYVEDSRVTIINSTGHSIDSFGIYGASNIEPESRERQLTLEPGTYYVKLESRDSKTGKYTLQVVDPSVKQVNPFTVNYINTTSTTIKGKTIPGAKVKAYVNNKQVGSIATADASGTYVIKNFPKQKQWTQVVIRANKSGYLQASKTIPVRKLFNVFTVNRVYNTSTKIRGKSIRGAEVRAYVNGKQIGRKVSVASNGGYNINIPKQKKGTRIVVKIVKSGYVPTQKTITVK